MSEVRNAIHLHFDRHGDLLLHLLGGAARPLRDDLDVVVRHVRIRLYRQRPKREDTPAEEQHRKDQHEKAVLQRKVDDRSHHCWVTVL